MKKNFITGLIILFPIALTFWIVSLLIGLLTNPFMGLVESFLTHTNLVDQQFLFLSGHDVLMLISRILILIILFLLMLLAGFFAQLFFLHSFFKMGDYLIHRIPIINKVYKATQDVTHTLFDQEKTTFSQVVLVPFPHAKSLSVGFITSKGMPSDSDSTINEKISIFVPGTPNPTMGFMLLYRRDQVIDLDISVEDALKFIVSCGVIPPPFGIK